MNCNILSRTLTPKNNLYVAFQTHLWHFKDSSSISSAEPSGKMDHLGKTVNPSHSFLTRLCRILLSLSLAKYHAEIWEKYCITMLYFFRGNLKKTVGFLRPLIKELLT